MPIVLNQYLEVRKDDEGNSRLFGKAGFQTMSPKTDRYVLANLAAIERALDAGELTDIDGNAVQDGAVILLYARVNKVKANSEIEQVGSIKSVTGATVAIPAASAPEASNNPF